jgi:hypothetical protein
MKWILTTSAKTCNAHVQNGQARSAVSNQRHSAGAGLFKRMAIKKSQTYVFMQIGAVTKPHEWSKQKCNDTILRAFAKINFTHQT